MMAGLLERAVTRRSCTSLGGPALMPERLTVDDPESSLMVRSGRGASVGGSFWERTVSRKLLLKLRPSGSATVTVRVAIPYWSGAGAMVTIRLVDAPEKAMFAMGTSEGLEDVAL